MLAKLVKPSNLPLLLALLLLLACTQITPTRMPRSVYEIQVIFDISQSMSVTDVVLDKRSSSRLALSKAAAQAMLKRLPCGSRVGWSAFTGRRTVTLLKPLEVCLHHDGLLSSLAQIDGRMRWVEGSSVGKGLFQSMRAARAIGKDARVVFITDGHEAPPLQHGQSGIPRLNGLQVMGLVVGVGGDTPAPIPKTDATGRINGFWQAHEVVQLFTAENRPSHEELSWLHSDHLVKLAQYTGLEYLRLKTVNSIAEAVKTAAFAHTREVLVDIRWIPALLALLLLGWRFLPLSHQIGKRRH